MRYDVTTFGELVIDLVPINTPKGLAYLPKPGGAPGNVAAGIARLGHRAAMISKVGTEAFGEAAVAALSTAGVAVGSVIRTSEHNTALAIVSETADGGSDFFFYRECCADSTLSTEEVPSDLIGASKIFHVGTLPLATPISAAAQRHAITVAKAREVMISTDVNFRPAFWRDPERMRAAGIEVVGAANVAKVSETELALLTGIPDTAEAARALWHDGLVMLAVTKGANGADLFTRDGAASVRGFSVAAVDTVGCGDAFMAALIASLIERGFEAPQGEALRAVALRSCAAGAIIATRSGALESMPTAATIEEFLAARS